MWCELDVSGSRSEAGTAKSDGAHHPRTVEPANEAMRLPNFHRWVVGQKRLGVEESLRVAAEFPAFGSIDHVRCRQAVQAVRTVLSAGPNAEGHTRTSLLNSTA